MVGYKPPGRERWLNEKYRIKSLLPPVDRWRRGKQCDTVSWQAIWLIKVTTIIFQMQVTDGISFKYFEKLCFTKCSFADIRVIGAFHHF
jgi:hypothetical protein